MQDQLPPFPPPTLSPPPAPGAATGDGLILTSSTYDMDSDYSAACPTEFGPNVQTADWSYVITQLRADILATRLVELGFALNDNALVTRDGSQVHDGTRKWFVERHDGSPPSNWWVVGQHGGLTLGSWFGYTMRVFCLNPNPAYQAPPPAPTPLIPTAVIPTAAPTAAPTPFPTELPTTVAPTAAPTAAPTEPLTAVPTAAPTAGPVAITPVSASMSSTLSSANFPGHDFGAAQCIDGVTNNNNGWNFCISSLNVANPWLSVQLPATSSVSSVVVYSREDCCQRWLNTFEVWVGDAAGLPSSSTATRCGVLTADLTTGPFTVTCSTPLSGSVVTLVLPGTRRGILLAEVTAYGST